VPIALVNETRRPEFATAYPELDTILRDQYVEVDTYRRYDGDDIRIAVRKDARASRGWGERNWPCEFSGEAAQPEPRGEG
jgi:hypothetical protein